MLGTRRYVMAETSFETHRDQLHVRRRRLEAVARTVERSDDIVRLLREVDDALVRIDSGAYGLCEACHDPIEEDRLLADPLIRFCLDHLTPIEQRRLEQDLSLAQRIQGALLPSRDFEHGGWKVHYLYEPVGPVGGDCCDVVPSQDGGRGIQILLGDVVGKGTAASMLMAQLHATFRSLADVGLPLAEMVERANRLFCQTIIPSHYATLIAARLDASGDIEICNAGHLPGLLRHEGRVARIGASGLPLGLFCSGQYDVVRYRLEPGAVLLLYTDGVTETRNSQGAEYGAERLSRGLERLASLAPADLVAACFEDLEAFRGGTPRTDDLTLMAIRRAG
jgi:sigma-B regulation protein RsbU (phosphoserine phosphatase)